MNRSFYWQEICPKLSKMASNRITIQKIQDLRKKTATNIYNPDEAAAIKWMNADPQKRPVQEASPWDIGRRVGKPREWIDDGGPLWGEAIDYISVVSLQMH